MRVCKILGRRVSRTNFGGTHGHNKSNEYQYDDKFE